MSPVQVTNMAAKFIILAVVAAVAQAGIYDSIGYSSQSLHRAAPIALATHARPLAVAHAAPIAIAHAAPIAHRVAYAAPIAHRVAYAAPIAHKVAVAAPVAHQVDYYDPNPHYSFEYNVHDGHTGDAKSQHETREGDVVHGSYSLVEPDGSTRTVEYTADPHNGFNAVVHRTPNAHPAVAVAHAPIAVKAIATPAIVKTAYAAPLLSHGYHG